MEKVPPQEIHQRLTGFQTHLATHDMDGAFLFQNVDLFYFCGTIQSPTLFIPAEGDPILMVQKGAATRPPWPRGPAFD
jgi:Xaa-Pro aminopeptidase